MSTDSQSSAGNTRWWESYLVRYFLGFIVGSTSIFIIILAFNLNGTNLKIDKDNYIYLTIIFLLLGFGYCYICSAPITVFHSGRMYRTWMDIQSRVFWMAWGLFITIKFINSNLIITNYLIVNFLPFALGVALIYFVSPFSLNRSKNNYFKIWKIVNLTNKLPKEIRTYYGFSLGILGWFLIIYSLHNFLNQKIENNDIQMKSTIINFYILSLPIFYIMITQYVLLFKCMVDPKPYVDFYIAAVKARSNKNLKATQDIRDTYSHLREHANSVFIVLIEILILCLFFAYSFNFYEIKFYGQFDTNEKSIINNYIIPIISFICLWLMPSMYMWSRANWLEEEFFSDPDLFLPKVEKDGPSPRRSPKRLHV